MIVDPVSVSGTDIEVLCEQEELALDVLDDLLMGTPVAPLYKTLRESGYQAISASAIRCVVLTSGRLLVRDQLRVPGAALSCGSVLTSVLPANQHRAWCLTELFVWHAMCVSDASCALPGLASRCYQTDSRQCSSRSRPCYALATRCWSRTLPCLSALSVMSDAELGCAVARPRTRLA